MNRSIWSTALLLLIALGCSSGNVGEMRGEGAAPPWEALQAFEDEPLRSVAYPLEMKDLKGAKAALQSEKFAEALNTFEASPLPDEYSDRQTQKDAMVQAWKAAIEAAKSGSPDEVKSAFDAASAKLAELHK